MKNTVTRSKGPAESSGQLPATVKDELVDDDETPWATTRSDSEEV